MTEIETKSGKRRKNADGDVIVIKKYANRRLYNTATSSYVTLDYLAEMVKNGEDFAVFDAKSGEDITHSVLTQIIFEEESKGQNLLPIQFLRQLIKFYGDSLQSFVPSYLEMSMDAFSRNQEQMRAQMHGAFGKAPGYAMFEESIRKNMTMYEQAMKMFSPMGAAYGAGTNSNTSDAPKNHDEGEDINTLKSQLAALQKQLDNLEKKSG